MKLKTLKELTKVGIMVPDLNSEKPCSKDLVMGEHVPIDEFRAEIIKWVKELRNQAAGLTDNPDYTWTGMIGDFVISCNGNDIIEQAHILQHIFNITEEELK